MILKNSNYCEKILKEGGYMAVYRNYKGSGIRGALGGVGLHNKDGRCVLTDCFKEFIHFKDKKMIRCDEEWGSETYSGQEWYWNGTNNQ